MKYDNYKYYLHVLFNLERQAKRMLKFSQIYPPFSNYVSHQNGVINSTFYKQTQSA